jgi:hypothetical protein
VSATTDALGVYAVDVELNQPGSIRVTAAGFVPTLRGSASVLGDANVDLSMLDLVDQTFLAPELSTSDGMSFVQVVGRAQAPGEACLPTPDGVTMTSAPNAGPATYRGDTFFPNPSLQATSSSGVAGFGYGEVGPAFVFADKASCTLVVDGGDPNILPTGSFLIERSSISFVNLSFAP